MRVIRPHWHNQITSNGQNGQNALVEVDILRKAARVIANSTLLSQNSSAAFERTILSRNSLYILDTGIFGDNSTVSASIVSL
ncbi:hypothetical protein B0O99DRAFT_617680 [Bisporella sp. PMI_857]|nr:hypothetical protein B0O99DRAFT_617680 [Bisporella sp. PMI_857]